MNNKNKNFIDEKNEKKSEAQGENNSEAVSETKSVAKGETKSEAQGETKSETVSEAQGENNSETESESKSESKRKKYIKKKPFYKRVWFLVLMIIVLIFGGTALSMPFSYGVQCGLIRLICAPKNKSVPTNYDEILNSTDVQYNISYNSSYANGQLDLISPKSNSEKLPIVVYFHGGYYVGGDKAVKEIYCRIIASEGYIIANVNYELAPEAKYPAQAIQANESIKYLVENADSYNIDTNKIFIAGDSAGAHLTGQMGAFYTNSELQTAMGFTPAISDAQLKGVVLLCGYYNMNTVRASKFPLNADALWMLTGIKKFEDYSRIDELNTINNVTANYPNTFLLCGSDDPFFSQNQEMKEKLDSMNVNTISYLPISTKDILWHEFQSDYSLIEAYVAKDLLIDFLNNYA